MGKSFMGGIISSSGAHKKRSGSMRTIDKIGWVVSISLILFMIFYYFYSDYAVGLYNIKWENANRAFHNG